MPASAESPTGTARNILLIEEYQALAAAIISALKKFAPAHRTRTVKSLNEAEAAAVQSKTQLLIIDLDPPRPGVVDFLHRMAVAHPDARALVIAPGMSSELISERFGPNGVQFVQKPFELAEFGAAVQALLGPWTKAENSRGTLRDLNLRDLVPLECVGEITAILKVTQDSEPAGQVHFVDGDIWHASSSGSEGLEALIELIRPRKTHAKEIQGSIGEPRTLHGPWQHVFLEALRQAKPSVSAIQPPLPAAAPTEERKPTGTQPKKGKKIVVIDDTEMLSIFVEDVLSTADPQLEIVTALTGNKGVALVEEIGPDLVLLDFSLPDIRGDQICERFLRNEKTGRIPVLMMSGHVPEMMATAERYPNVVATLAKPFMSGALVSLVTKTLAQGPLPAELEKRRAAGGPTAKTSTSIGAAVSIAPATKSQIKVPKPALPSKRGKETVTVLPAQTITPAPSLASGSSIELIAPSQAPSLREVGPAQGHRLESYPIPAIRQARLASPNDAVAVMLGMEVISVQLSPRFQIKTIRARPSPTTLSLTLPRDRTLGQEHWGTGFELGTVDLDPNGQIKMIRVLPMRRPAGSIRAHSGFDINDVKLLNGTAVMLTSGMAVPMTMQIVAAVKIVEVELNDRFEVSQLSLWPQSNRFRATLNPAAHEKGGAEFETVNARLDSSARLAELVFTLIS